MTGTQLVHIQDRLSEINKVQKRINLETSITRDKIMIDEIKQYFFDLTGSNDKIKEFAEKADAILNTNTQHT